MGPYAVKFNASGYGARVFTDPKSFPVGALVSPDISSVLGRVSPSHWKLDENGIHPMTEEEIEKHIEPIVQSEWNSGPNLLSSIDDLRAWLGTSNDDFETEKRKVGDLLEAGKRKFVEHDVKLFKLGRRVEEIDMGISAQNKRFYRGQDFLFILISIALILQGVLWLRK